MNKVCKDYLSDAKKFFPIIRKNEKKYLQKVAENIDEFCDEKNITDKDELFKEYGPPYEIANNYYSAIDTQEIIKKIKFTKYIKILIISLVIICFIALSVFCTYWKLTNDMILREEVVMSKEITNSSQTDNNEKDVIKSNNFIEDEDAVSEKEIIE